MLVILIQSLWILFLVRLYHTSVLIKQRILQGRLQILVLHFLLNTWTQSTFLDFHRELKLKVGVAVMLMRNLNQKLGLCKAHDWWLRNVYRKLLSVKSFLVHLLVLNTLYLEWNYSLLRHCYLSSLSGNRCLFKYVILWL